MQSATNVEVMKFKNCLFALVPASLFLNNAVKAIIRRGIRVSSAANHQMIRVALVVVVSCAFLTAQNVVLTGSLGGRVTDASGALSRERRSLCGTWRPAWNNPPIPTMPDFTGFPVVMPAAYSITAGLKGFRDVQVLVRVLVGNTTSQDIKMQVEPVRTPCK
jgi:hypothetical protein